MFSDCDSLLRRQLKHLLAPTLSLSNVTTIVQVVLVLICKVATCSVHSLTLPHH